MAKEMGLRCVDLDRAMPMHQRYFTDPIHMSEAGNGVKAKLVAETLTE